MGAVQGIDRSAWRRQRDAMRKRAGVTTAQSVPPEIADRMEKSLAAAKAVMRGQSREVVQVAALALFLGAVKRVVQAAPSGDPVPKKKN